MILFELLYFLKDSTMIKIKIGNELLYSGDVYTYRTTPIERYAIHMKISSIDIVIEFNTPVIIITLGVK